jgi:hypothetical protein
MKSLRSITTVDTLSKNDFLTRFKRPEMPVKFEHLTDDWPARQKWSIDYFKDVAGDRIVPLYDSQPSKDRKHQHAPAAQMPLADYLDRLQAGENDLRLFFYNILQEVPELTRDFDYPDIGLPFFRKLPVLFMGGTGAKVQMHYDIDLADIFLCHFGGKKKVMLFPPDQTPLMYKVPFSFSSLFDVNYRTPDLEKYPALQYLEGYETELNHGDILYIPPGWWHYIEYEELSFSMALRAFPRRPKNLATMLKNLLWTRSIEGLMRKTVGQAWNDRNEKRAVQNTHRYLAKHHTSPKG